QAEVLVCGPLVQIMSCAGAPLGLSASQLYSFEPVEWVALKSCENWSNTLWMVSEPTPTTSAGFGVTPLGGSARAGPAASATAAAAAAAPATSLVRIRNFLPSIETYGMPAVPVPVL